ncbi:hypothetical protein [Shewanella litorisediminis]|nr:hypothetical protein [Shewanella litorisediminis]
MKRKTINNHTAARRRTLVKFRHSRLLRRQKLFFSLIQSEE